MTGEQKYWSTQSVETIKAAATGEFGPPNDALSNGNELRFGTNGSIKVDLAGPWQGHWHDFENDTTGWLTIDESVPAGPDATSEPDKQAGGEATLTTCCNRVASRVLNWLWIKLKG